MRRIVLLCLSVLACSPGKPAQHAPAAPTNLVANAGDGQVTVLWDPVAGAISYALFIADGAAAAARTDVGGATSWTAVGLTNGHSYGFSVSAVGSAGEGARSAAVTATPAPNLSLAVTAMPGDAATSVARNTSIIVAFNKTLTTSTVTTGSGCTGSVVLSSDSFSNCVAMGAPASADGKTFTVAPAQPLKGATGFKLRVTKAVKDGNGVALAAELNTSFTTSAELTATITVNSAIALRPVFTVAFNRPTLPASVSFGPACTGAVRLSPDNFIACVALAHSVVSGLDTFTPVADLPAATAFTFQVAAVKDSDGVALAAPATATVATPRPLTVSVQPADASLTGDLAPLVTLFFSAPIDPASLTLSSSGGACTGSLQLTSDSFGTCVGLVAPLFDRGNQRVMTRPTANLAAAVYKIKVTTAVHEPGGLRLAAESVTSFTTVPALVITLRTPADGSTNVSTLPKLTVNFSRAAANVTAGTSCSSTTFQLLKDSDGSCVPLSAAASSNGGATWSATPMNALGTGVAYHVKISAAVTDGDGVPLGTGDSWGFSCNGSVNGSPPDVAISATARANSVDLSWSSPGGSFAGVHIYAKPASAASYPASYIPVTSSPYTLQLSSGGWYDILVKSFDSSGNESQGTEVRGLVTAFSGSGKDFLSGQTATGAARGSFYQGWTDSEFLAGFTLANGTTLNPINGDALWIGFSTTGTSTETETVTSPNGGTVIWPFGVDYIVEVKNMPGGLVENLRNAATGTWCSSTDATGCPLTGAITASINASIVEVRFNKSVVGNPAGAEVAMIAVATHSGDTAKGQVFDLAPSSLAAIDTLGTWASLTSAYAPGTNIFKSSTGTATTATTALAPALVSFSVSNAAAFTGPDVKIKGGKHPFSYDLSESSYHLDLAGDGKTASGTFNLGGQLGELFFKFDDHGIDEPLFSASGKDRVYALGLGSGPTESVPSLAWSTAGATSFTLSFFFSAGGNPTGVGGDQLELGNSVPSSAAGPLTKIDCSLIPSSLPPPGWAWSSPTCYLLSVTFPAGRDFVTSPLNFEAVYQDLVSLQYSFEDPSKTHVMDDDVINHRYLLWNARDFSTTY